MTYAHWCSATSPVATLGTPAWGAPAAPDEILAGEDAEEHLAVGQRKTGHASADEAGQANEVAPWDPSRPSRPSRGTIVRPAARRGRHAWSGRAVDHCQLPTLFPETNRRAGRRARHPGNPPLDGAEVRSSACGAPWVGTGLPVLEWRPERQGPWTA